MNMTSPLLRIRYPANPPRYFLSDCKKAQNFSRVSSVLFLGERCLEKAILYMHAFCLGTLSFKVLVDLRMHNIANDACHMLVAGPVDCSQRASAESTNQI